MPHTTGTLGKLMAVLDLVCNSETPLRFTEILQLSDQPRGTLHRHLMHLVEEGLLEATPDGGYQAGLRILKLASKAWSSNQVRQISAPHLQRLHELTGETVHFGVLSGTEIIYVDKVEGRQLVRMHSNIGKVSPLHCTGVGKAALSALPPAALDQLLSTLIFTRFTPNTLTNAAALRCELDQIRRQGFALDREEHETGICCVAAPIRSSDESWVGAVSISGPAFRVTEEQLAGWSDSVCQTATHVADELASRLGPKSNLILA